MKLKIVVHDAEEGGYWAEVPAIPGCATQGETWDELLQNLYEAVDGCLAATDELRPEYDFSQMPGGVRGKYVSDQLSKRPSPDRPAPDRP